MPKPRRKTISKKPIMPRLLSWGRDWWLYFSSGVRQSWLQFVGCLGMSTLIIFVLVLGFYYLVFPSANFVFPGTPGTLEWDTQVMVFLILIYLFLFFLFLVFIFSLHPRTRWIPDRLFRLMGQPELEKLKIQVKNIESRLESIENTLKNMANKKNKIKQKRQG